MADIILPREVLSTGPTSSVHCTFAAMALTLCTYNVEHFNRAFDEENRPKSDSEKQLEAVAQVLRAVDADLIGIVEAPNASPSAAGDGETPGTVEALETFAAEYDLRQRKTAMGFVSEGSQELAVMYDPDTVEEVKHVPGGGRGLSPAFDEELFYDADGDDIEEVYAFYRPPFEAEVTAADSGKTFRLILAHAKSKATFGPMDRLHRRQESLANRKKIFAECNWIRKRVEEWMDDHPVVVMGDFNDGPGMDFFERKFGKTGVEFVIGSLFEPDTTLRSAYERPRWTGNGWRPYTASFWDDVGEGYVEVPIDYVLATRNLRPAEGQVWNPDQKEALEETLYEASDHFPVSMVIESV